MQEAPDSTSLPKNVAKDSPIVQFEISQTPIQHLASKWWKRQAFIWILARYYKDKIKARGSEDVFVRTEIWRLLNVDELQ